MSRFGPRVVAAAARMIDEVTGTFTTIDNFLSECGVPQEVLKQSHGGRGGRLGHLHRVLTHLDDNDADRAHIVLQELAARLRSQRRVGDIERLGAALREKGFELGDEDRICPTEILAEETEEIGDYLDELIRANEGFLSVETLRHHLKQHRILYAQGTAPGAAAGQARQFIEQLLADITNVIANSQGHSPNLGRPVLVRTYLREQGFFDEDELRRLVDGVYGYLSEIGAHPGVTDTTMGRMARVIFLNFGVYLLEKFQAFSDR